MILKTALVETLNVEGEGSIAYNDKYLQGQRTWKVVDESTKSWMKSFWKHKWQHQEMYFTTEDKIYVGDWVTVKGHDKPVKVGLWDEDYKRFTQSGTGMTFQPHQARKIVATTDPKLLPSYKPLDGQLAKVPENFVEKFVWNNGKVVDIMLSYKGYMPQKYGRISDGVVTHEICMDPSYNTLQVHQVRPDGTVAVFAAQQIA
jgi:hypothetical protein